MNALQRGLEKRYWCMCSVPSLSIACSGKRVEHIILQAAAVPKVLDNDNRFRFREAGQLGLVSSPSQVRGCCKGAKVTGT